jgi:glutathione S-transferase
MSKLKLTYFDFHGGRGEPARLALSIGGIPFEDDRVAPADWPARKPDTPFGALPVLEVDGQTLAQSNAINRYVGKLTDLYPLDAWQAALWDEVMEAVEDINTKLAATFFLPEEEKKTQRKALAINRRNKSTGKTGREIPDLILPMEELDPAAHTMLLPAGGLLQVLRLSSPAHVRLPCHSGLSRGRSYVRF